MFRKSLITYVVINSPNDNDAQTVLDILVNHDRTVETPIKKGITVLVHMKINDEDDLAIMVTALYSQFPRGVQITPNPPYQALRLFKTPTSRKEWKRKFIFGTYVYLTAVASGATVTGFLSQITLETPLYQYESVLFQSFTNCDSTRISGFKEKSLTMIQ